MTRVKENRPSPNPLPQGEGFSALALSLRESGLGVGGIHPLASAAIPKKTRIRKEVWVGLRGLALGFGHALDGGIVSLAGAENRNFCDVHDLAWDGQFRRADALGVGDEGRDLGI